MQSLSPSRPVAPPPLAVSHVCAPIILLRLPRARCLRPKPSAPAVTMVAAPACGAARELAHRERYMQMMLAAEVHLGTKNCDFQMERYTHMRRTDGINPIQSSRI